MSDKIELEACPFCGGACDPRGWVNVDGEMGPECEDCGATAPCIEVWNRRAALAQQPAAAVPDGWKLVPVEPTIDMEDAGRKAASGFMRLGEAGRVFRAMLAASPAAPAPEAQGPVRMHHEPHNRAMWHENCPGRRFSSPMMPRGDGSWACVACGAVGSVTAPPAAEQPDTVKVPRELLERIAQQLYWSSDEYQKLRALLAGGAHDKA
ncbi:hypothetical protein [Pseudomonas sp.]|uniref:hypothetical protein n=1 Tax=Pseudomonas sp. TaxID=306 RepID=UPI0025870D9A|nr:hypothetical protein [Pseudomonas sp.]